jgi:hypothetical protein
MPNQDWQSHFQFAIHILSRLSLRVFRVFRGSHPVWLKKRGTTKDPKDTKKRQKRKTTGVFCGAGVPEQSISELW